LDRGIFRAVISHHGIRDHYLPPDKEAFRAAEPPTGRIIVIAPTRAACETIELAMDLRIDTVLEREHGEEIRQLARGAHGFGIVAGTGTGKTLAIRPIAEEIVSTALKIGVVNREREATPDTPSWNVVIVTTGIARRWFQSDLIQPQDTLVVDEIHQTSAELELCLALGKRIGCRFVWLSATVDPAFYARYLNSDTLLTTTAFDPTLSARVTTLHDEPLEFLDDRFIRRVIREKRGVAVFVPTRAQVEAVASELAGRWPNLTAAFYHGGEPIRVIRPFLEGTAEKPYALAMTAAGQSALNVRGLDTVVIYDARFSNVIARGRNVLTRLYLGANEILQMAGRVHGRVANGEVYILTERDVDFEILKPEPPEFQLAGDSERVALTAAAMGVDLTELELPVPLDRTAYRAAVERLTARGVIAEDRLTRYGRDVEAMPVDRPWGELLVQMDDELTPLITVMANVESLHRMTRDERDLRGLAVEGSDHLTSYQLYAEAVNTHGYLGQVYGLPRHLFEDELADWADSRGVLVKAVEDVALGMASVYRTLEIPLPERLPRLTPSLRRRVTELVARVMPFDLVIDEKTADDEPVAVARGSLCKSWGAVAGTIRYFAGRFGEVRGAIEGNNLPLSLIRRHARQSPPFVQYRNIRRRGTLCVVQTLDYFGFELDRTWEPLSGRFPADLAESARAALAAALVAGETPHPHQAEIRRDLDHFGKYWRRSGGKLSEANPKRVHSLLQRQLGSTQSWDDFLETPLGLDLDGIIPLEEQSRLDGLPSSVPVRGDRLPLDYEIEDGVGVVRLRLREGKARKLRRRDVPTLDRPLRFTVLRGRQTAARASSYEELRKALAALPERPKHRHAFRPRRRR
jgi:hypothetical protein